MLYADYLLVGKLFDTVQGYLYRRRRRLPERWYNNILEIRLCQRDYRAADVVHGAYDRTEPVLRVYPFVELHLRICSGHAHFVYKVRVAVAAFGVFLLSKPYGYSIFRAAENGNASVRKLRLITHVLDESNHFGGLLSFKPLIENNVILFVQDRRYNNRSQDNADDYRYIRESSLFILSLPELGKRLYKLIRLFFHRHCPNFPSLS